MIKVSNTSGGKRSGKRSAEVLPDAVRVYKDGVMVGEVFPGQRNPLGYLKKTPRSKYRKQLDAQLNANGLSDIEISEVYS